MKKKTNLLVIAGNPKEMIDGVRYYANHARPKDHGKRVAAELEKAGFHVIVHEAETAAADMLQAVKKLLQHEPVDVVLQLANVCSFRAAHMAETKLKVKKETGRDVPMEVIGNVDVTAHLRAVMPQGTVMGYDNYQGFFEQGDVALRDRLRPVIESACHAGGHKETAPATLALGPLRGKKIIVTSGPTVELLTTSGDVITNISSGEQGFAVARALTEMGAHVRLIAGESARAMREAVMRELPADVYVGVAAVADFGVASPAPLILKENETHTLMLKQNPDILYDVGHHAKRPAVVIGFAAETHDVLAYANEKLTKKGADAICANAVDEASRRHIGAGNNQITWLAKGAAAENWPVMSKADVGRRIGEKIVALLSEK